MYGKKDTLKKNVESSKITELQCPNIDTENADYKENLKHYERFKFLSADAKAMLARAEATAYDKQFLSQKKKKLGEFLQKQISIKSSLILTLWYSLFDLLYLAPHLLDKMDEQYVEMCFRTLLVKKMAEFEFELRKSVSRESDLGIGPACH